MNPTYAYCAARVPDHRVGSEVHHRRALQEPRPESIRDALAYFRRQFTECPTWRQRLSVASSTTIFSQRRPSYCSFVASRPSSYTIVAPFAR